VQAGEAIPLEATQARADSALADHAIVRVAAEEKIAEQRLRALIGFALREQELRLRALPPPADCTQPMTELIRDALADDIQGGQWIYEQTAPNVFTRRRVEVQRVEGALAVLSRGPKAGAAIVTSGAAELFGIEFGAGK
jgi:hypothetical protein